MTFSELELIEPIQKALKVLGYEKPTPIQAQAIPLLLQERDLLGCAQTGTGKTAAFAIPILQLLHKKGPQQKGSRKIKTLIVTPTRELAIQIGESFADYGKFLHLNHTVIFGGVGQKSQTDALRNGIDILIATPGRLLDLMNQRFVSLKDVEFFVLDEADRMLDMGFIHDVKKLIAALPKQRQSLFFSATMPPAITQLANTILNNPVRVEVTPVSSTAETINQFLYYVDRNNKYDLLLHLLDSKEIKTALVFTRTKHGADKVVKVLAKEGIKSAAIHGNKSQNARQNALENFKNQSIRVLVATDIAARGIDIDDLAHVINFEIPNISETYVHRIGRTGRAGANGTAISFCDAEEKEFLKDIHKLINKQIPVIDDHPYPYKGIMPEKKATDNRGGRRNSQGGGNSNKPKSNGNQTEASQGGERPKKKYFKQKVNR
jgi:ATP-dependent RNA helicase RhlE